MNIRACPVTPDTRRLDLTFESNGIKAKDDYNWLETDSESRQTWLRDQMTRTDCHLDSYPKHQQIKARLLELLEPEKAKGTDKGYVSKRVASDGFELQYLRDPDQRDYRIVRFTSEADQKGEVVFDPNTWPDGETLAWSQPSPNRRYLAFAKRINGKDTGEMTILDLKEQKTVLELDSIRTTQHARWNEGGTKLYFRGPSSKQRGLSVFDSESQDVSRISKNTMSHYGEMAEHEGGVLFTSTGKKYGEETLRFVNPAGGEQKLELPDGEMSFTQSGKNVFILTDGQAPNGQILKADLEALTQGQPGISSMIPNEPGRVIKKVALHGETLAVNYDYNGSPGVAFYDSEGRQLQDFRSKVPGAFTVTGVKDGSADLHWTSLIEKGVQKKLNLETGEVETVKESEVPGFDPDDYIVERKWYKSEDGTSVPMTVAHKKSLELNGQNPTHIYVYGGFNNSVYTGYQDTVVPFLEEGGVYAIAHVRGGNELGREWHEQAMGVNRHKVYEDVAGAAKFLSEEGYASSDTLSVGGGSNGGLVTGVAVTRNPELFDAAVGDVGLYDMFRYESIGGQYWKEEYGSISNPEEGRSLMSWSPYHNVDESKEYPAILITTGKNDDRVNPAHSYKFAARMQDAETADHPVYLRVDEHLGHGAGATPEEKADRYADQWSFLLSELTDGD